MNVAVIGASNKPHRYSYKAVKLLQEKGHSVYPVHRRVKDIEGINVYADIGDIPDKIDTVSLYISADISDQIGPDILTAKPRRIIFNPGAENPQLKSQAEAAGIQALNACTLVLLRTAQF